MCKGTVTRKSDFEAIMTLVTKIQGIQRRKKKKESTTLSFLWTIPPFHTSPQNHTSSFPSFMLKFAAMIS